MKFLAVDAQPDNTSFVDSGPELVHQFRHDFRPHAAELGVDALFVEAPQSMSELEEIARQLAPLGLPLVANMIEKGQTPLLTPAELHELGYTLIAAPLSMLFAATKAMRDVLAVLRDKGTTRDDLSMLVPFDEFGTIVDLPGHYAREARFR